MAKRKRIRVHRLAQRKPWKSAIRIVGIVAVLSAFIVLSTHQTLTSEAAAQQPVHANHVPGQTFDPLIDGSQNPEGVPDSVAIRTLMQTLRIPENPDETTLQQLRMRVANLGFSSADLDILVRELGNLDRHVRDQQAIVNAARPSSAEPSHSAVTRYIEEQKTFGAILSDHYQQIRGAMSPAGSAALQEHLFHIKSRIKIYPTPNMSPNAHPSGEVQ